MTASTMTESLRIACPACLTLNRVPAARLQQAPKCGQCHGALLSGHPAPLTQASFDRILNGSDLPVVIDFWAPWCGPCKMMAPEYEKAAAELAGTAWLAKVDTEAEPTLGSRFGIRGIPTLVLFKQGKEITRHSGAIRSADIVRFVQSATA
jgi:thioredoxin 2